MGQKDNCKRGEYVQLNYHDSFVYPLKKKDGSFSNIRINLNGFFFLAPVPSQNPQSNPKELSLKTIVFTEKNLH